MQVREQDGCAPAFEAQSAHSHDQARVPDVENRKHVGERILTIFHQLGTGATDTASGFSRTTVARWRKRLLAQGQLPGADECAPPPLPRENETAGEPEQQS